MKNSIGHPNILCSAVGFVTASVLALSAQASGNFVPGQQICSDVGLTIATQSTIDGHDFQEPIRTSSSAPGGDAKLRVSYFLNKFCDTSRPITSVAYGLQGSVICCSSN